jgi:hypothetical protein
MSGGSFDYLCYKDPEDLFYHLDTIKEMEDKLRELGCTKGADATKAFHDDIKDTYARFLKTREALSTIWHAVEWGEDNDYNPEQVQEILNRFQKP